MGPVRDDDAEALRAPTVTAEGKRRWIYPDRRPGRLATKRRRWAIALMAFYLAAPYASWQGRPLLRFDVVHGTLHFLGGVFRFQQVSVIAFIFIALALLLFFVTSLWGRWWCGYACPQTVFVEWLIRPIEELIEGKAHHRAIEDAKPLTPRRFLRKVAKHAAFIVVAMAVSHSFLLYFAAPSDVAHWVSSTPAEHPLAFALTWLVVGVLYVDMAWFREQFCSFLCPYARFQSVMMDAATPTITYDAGRGEPRGKRGAKGDCIDCRLCVRVCPTGIDIRQGLQLECIQCGRCADACDQVMGSLKRPLGLIAQSAAKDAKAPRVRWRPIFYGLALAVATSLLAWRISASTDVKVSVIRQPGAAFSRLPDGRIANIFQVRVTNDTLSAVSLRVTPVAPAELAVICGACGASLAPGDESLLSLILAVPATTAVREARFALAAQGEAITVPFVMPGQP